MTCGCCRCCLNLLQKFKARVLKKLYGDPESDSDDDHADEASNSSALSGIDTDRAREVKLYGAKCCPTGSKHIRHVSEPVHLVGSSSYASDNEESEGGSTLKREKRKRKHTCSQALLKAQLEASSSSSGSSHHPGGSAQPKQTLGQQTLSKNQKRKLKKKHRASDRRTSSSQSTEFQFDSSMNKCVPSEERVTFIKNSKDKLNSVLEFLEAIWDVFFSDHPNEAPPKNDIKHLLTTLENAENNEVHLLFSVMSALVLQGQDKSLRKIECFQEKTSLDPELSALATKLFTYWTMDVMNS
ncbi:uncharacterized protein LOC131930430 isoform X2 [Physella acuta]|uniref:uncharacterized protein LOC131930430 isoform X2 n=1 Tax=Physella acuta TaxID=109671 RepID=UPI0027DCBAAE|nr:uncharacterized protein LOC131930430 isoform X2 [Physella acuta]